MCISVSLPYFLIFLLHMQNTISMLMITATIPATIPDIFLMDLFFSIFSESTEIHTVSGHISDPSKPDS